MCPVPSALHICRRDGAHMHYTYITLHTFYFLFFFFTTYTEAYTYALTGLCACRTEPRQCICVNILKKNFLLLKISPHSARFLGELTEERSEESVYFSFAVPTFHQQVPNKQIHSVRSDSLPYSYAMSWHMMKRGPPPQQRAQDTKNLRGFPENRVGS